MGFSGFGLGAHSSLFFYTADLIQLVNQTNLHIHLYADDTEFYTFHPEDAATRLESCFKTVADWMAANHLALNTDKTDLLWVYGPHRHLPSFCTQIS